MHINFSVRLDSKHASLLARLAEQDERKRGDVVRRLIRQASAQMAPSRDDYLHDARLRRRTDGK